MVKSQVKIKSCQTVLLLPEKVPDGVAHRVHHGLDHALRLAPPVVPAHGLAAHGGQDVVAGAQADEERKGHEPDADAKIRRDHGEAGDVDVVVVRGSLVGAGLRVGEVAEPRVVIAEDEDCFASQSAPVCARREYTAR